MPIFGILATLMQIFLWFLKRRDSKAYEEWKNDIEKFNKALVDDDNDELTLAFERLRKESNRDQGQDDKL